MGTDLCGYQGSITPNDTVHTDKLNILEGELRNTFSNIIDQWNVIPVESVKACTLVAFIYQALNVLMHSAGHHSGVLGLEKKKFVLLIMGDVYDKVVYPYLPLWLKPFSSRLKSFILNVVLDESINFLVARVKQGKPYNTETYSEFSTNWIGLSHEG